jgi:serine/threonine-protein kinase
VVLTAYAAGGPPGADVVENLTLGGALVRTDTSLPVDTEVRLDVQLAEGGALSLSGVVVRSEPGAVGVRFTLDDTTRGALMQVLLGLGRAAQERRPPLQVRYDTPTAVAADRRTLLLGGVFVRGARPLPLQSTVTVEVELPEAQRFKCTGEVVSIEAQGVGVELQLEEGERTRFQRAVEAQARRASAPPPPTREAEVAPLLDELTPMPRKKPEEPERPRVGTYELLSLLGRGGMAEVYYARAVAGPHAGQCVAIKRLLPALASDPTAVELFIGEADLSRLLMHPTVVRTLDVGTYGGGYYLVMEHVDGRDLGQVLRRCQQRGLKVPVDFAVYIVRTLLEALAYAHEAKGLSGRVLGVVHRDVSPSNVFISRLGEVKLGDFGVARVRGMAADGPMAGKLAFLSPEALEGEVSPAVDVWAANVVLYELLTLVRPFGGETPEETAEAVRACRYTPVRQLRPEVPPQLAALVDRAFAPKASERLTSAAEYAEALLPLGDERVGNPMAIAALVRGLFDAPTRQ